MTREEMVCLCKLLSDEENSLRDKFLELCVSAYTYEREANELDYSTLDSFVLKTAGTILAEESYDKALAIFNEAMKEN